MINNINQDFLSRRLEYINSLIDKACERSNRKRKDISILPVTKKISVDLINILKDLNFHSFGENNLKEIKEKSKFFLKNPNKWVMIGHAQTNKSKYIVEYCDEILSLDRLELAESLNKYLVINNKIIYATVEIKTSTEPTKHGLQPEKLIDFLYCISCNFPNIKIIGLMTIAENTQDRKIIRSCFKKLYDLQNMAKKQNIKGIRLDKLSMGMSNDFDIAIEEGATEIRLGSAIFGDLKIN